MREHMDPLHGAWGDVPSTEPSILENREGFEFLDLARIRPIGAYVAWSDVRGRGW
jgi:hypothetical protein